MKIHVQIRRGKIISVASLRGYSPKADFSRQRGRIYFPRCSLYSAT